MIYIHKMEKKTKQVEESITSTEDRAWISINVTKNTHSLISNSQSPDFNLVAQTSTEDRARISINVMKNTHLLISNSQSPDFNLVAAP
jgi:protease II